MNNTSINMNSPYDPLPHETNNSQLTKVQPPPVIIIWARGISSPSAFPQNGLQWVYYLR